jgi:hypothetical protein
MTLASSLVDHIESPHMFQIHLPQTDAVFQVIDASKLISCFEVNRCAKTMLI